MTVSRTLLAVLAFLLTACQHRAETANEAIQIANAELEDMPLGLHLRTVEAIDMGDRWRLSYKLPRGSTGGPIVVIVMKHTGEVIHIETQQ